MGSHLPAKEWRIKILNTGKKTADGEKMRTVIR